MSKVLNDTRWAASVEQEYVTRPKGLKILPQVSTRTAQVALLHFRASSAQDAMDIASKWLEQSGIKNAYVGSVYLDGMVELDVVTYADDENPKEPDIERR